MSGHRFWPWLAGAAAVHLAAALVMAPRPAPRPEVRVRVATAVSFHAANAAAPAAATVSRAEPEAPSAPAAPQSASAPASVAPDAGSVNPASEGGKPSPDTDSDPVGIYLANLRQTVADHKSYPYAARTRRQEGTVLLAFRLDQAGGLTDEPHVVRSSGYPRLDAAAVEAVKVASPFVPPPESARPWEFRLPVEFVVR